VPIVVRSCLRYLDSYGMYVEGIFRVPGDMEAVGEMKKAFDAGGDVEALEDRAGVHEVSRPWHLRHMT
jgi:hypothetical protein